MVSADADETENYTYAIVLQIEMRVNGSNGVDCRQSAFGVSHGKSRPSEAWLRP